MAIVAARKHRSGDTGIHGPASRSQECREGDPGLVISHEVDAAWIRGQYRPARLALQVPPAPRQPRCGAPGTSRRKRQEGLLAIADFVPGQSETNKRYAEAYRREYNEEYDATSSGPTDR